MMFLFFIAIMVLVFWLMKDQGFIINQVPKEGKDTYEQKQVSKETSKTNALEALDIRFVNGEIDEATYMRMKELIK